MKTLGIILVAVGAILLAGANEVGIYPLMLGAIIYYGMSNAVNKKGI